MKASLLSEPWFLPLFGVIWVAALGYVSTFFFTIVRVRKLTGEAQGSNDWITVWRDPMTVRYLGWIFSGRHRALGDPLVSRLVLVVRTLFILVLPSILALFAIVLWSR
jgi:hypothetical protein